MRQTGRRTGRLISPWRVSGDAPPICPTPMRPDRIAGTWRRPACSYYASGFPACINGNDQIDEAVRERALRPTRGPNFVTMLDNWGDLLSAEARLPDVGCAHGGFLDAAKGSGRRYAGIEPDSAITTARAEWSQLQSDLQLTPAAQAIQIMPRPCRRTSSDCRVTLPNGDGK